MASLNRCQPVAMDAKKLFHIPLLSFESHQETSGMENYLFGLNRAWKKRKYSGSKTIFRPLVWARWS